MCIFIEAKLSIVIFKIANCVDFHITSLLYFLSPSSAGIEYASMVWGDHSLTLLCPHSNQPYLPIPDFMQRVREKDYRHYSQR